MQQNHVAGLSQARARRPSRNPGLVAGIGLEPREGAPCRRAGQVFHVCFDERLLVRATAYIVALSPPLIVQKSQIDEMVAKLGEVLARTS